MFKHARFSAVITLALAMLLFLCAARPAQADTDLADGCYLIEVSMEGGTGRASVDSPTNLVVSEGQAVATITWSSPNYDYMIIDGTTYQPTITEGNSTFEIPVLAFDEPFTVVADTTAMSVPHEIEYQLTFDSASATPVEVNTGSHGKTLAICAIVCAALGCAFVIWRRRQQG